MLSFLTALQISPVVCAGFLALFALLAILYPLVTAEDRPLQPGSRCTTLAEVSACKDHLLGQFLRSESALAAGNLEAREWEQRRAFLENRYIDFSRQEDRLRELNLEQR